MNHLSIEIPETSLSSNDKLSQAILAAAALQLYRTGNLSSQRAARLSKLSHSQFLKQTGEIPDVPDSPPEQAERLKGSRYLARVLWALSEGEKNRLALAVILMRRPRHGILLDEPSLGLAPLVTAEVFDRLRDITDRTGTAVLLVEQNANLALDFAGRAYVLEAGEIVASGPAAQLQHDETVQKAYLGI